MYFLVFSLSDNIPRTTEIIPIGSKSKNFVIDEENLKIEFDYLTMYIDKDEKHKSELLEQNKELDRYKDIRCNKNNSITLGVESKYINASNIGVIFRTNYFITTQAPKTNTIEDFWRMIYQEKTKVVIMLCNFEEGGKKKCANYLPSENNQNNQNFQNAQNFQNVQNNQNNQNNQNAQNAQNDQNDQNIQNEIKVNLIRKEVYEEFDIRTLELELNNDKRTVTHIHYKKWPDKGVPDMNSFNTFEEIIKIVDQINKSKHDKEKENEFHPIVVHCSAGVGRTGTFISMFCLYKEIKMAQIDKRMVNSIQFNIFNLVRKMKEMRLYMVQTFEQYKFVYQFAQYLLNKYN